jgi:hypothetical protein
MGRRHRLLALAFAAVTIGLWAAIRLHLIPFPGH